jgi:hypothetical protein
MKKNKAAKQDAGEPVHIHDFNYSVLKRWGKFTNTFQYRE